MRVKVTVQISYNSGMNSGKVLRAKSLYILLLVIGSVVGFSKNIFAADENKIKEETSKVINVRIFPIYLLVGTYGATLDVGVGKHMTIGPHFDYSPRPSDETINQYNLGLELRFTPRKRFTDGLYIAPFYYCMHEIEASSSPYLQQWNGPHEFRIYGFNIGYQWYWPSGFNSNLGAGITNDPHSEGISIDFALGWCF